MKSAERARRKPRSVAVARPQRKIKVSSDPAAALANTSKQLFKRGDHLLLGLSGGVDSMVLLDVMARASKRAGWHLSAMHVNHQLSQNAARWAAFCRRACRERGVPLQVRKVTVVRGNSTEAAARAVRYAAFRKARVDYIVLAHNQDDQCETLFLQMLRGAGIKGLAAMPLTRIDAKGAGIARPLLGVPRSSIEAYARKRELQWIEDESNSDPQYLRNYLRSEIFPRIAARAPAYRATLARASAHLGEAAELLDDLAAIDARPALVDDTLAVEALRRMPDARARNLLRYFLARRGVTMPNADKLSEALRQALTADDASTMCIDLGVHALRRFDDALYVVRKCVPPNPEVCVEWHGQRQIRLPEFVGVLHMAASSSGGISQAKLCSAPVTVRVRKGGERLQPDARRPRRTLKNLFQTLAIPPWRRDRLPLLWCGGDLVWVPGMGVDCRYEAQRGESAIAPRWRSFE